MLTLTHDIPVGRYVVDPVHSSVGFAVRHMVSNFRGSFGEVDASLQYTDEGELSLEGSVPVSSVEVREPSLAAHLATPDFFDAARYPRVAFRSTAVRIAEDGGLELDGELTIRDVTRPIVARGELLAVPADLMGGARVGVDLETVIDRTDYGINFNAPLPKGGNALANDVRLHVELEFTLAPEQEA
jgi:polyisoprenoid-binding protein YceI